MAQQEAREDSILNYYKKLIALRKSEEFRELFTYGDFQPMLEDEEGILSYCRSLNEKKVVVVANFGQESAAVSDPFFADGRCLLSNAEVTVTGEQLRLLPAQVVVLTK